MTGGLDRLPATDTSDVLTRRLLACSPGGDVTSYLPLPRAATPYGQPGTTLALTSEQVKRRHYHLEAPDSNMRLVAAARIPCTSA